MINLKMAQTELMFKEIANMGELELLFNSVSNRVRTDVVHKIIPFYFARLATMSEQVKHDLDLPWLTPEYYNDPSRRTRDVRNYITVTNGYAYTTDGISAKLQKTNLEDGFYFVSQRKLYRYYDQNWGLTLKSVVEDFDNLTWYNQLHVSQLETDRYDIEYYSIEGYNDSIALSREAVEPYIGWYIYAKSKRTSVMLSKTCDYRESDKLFITMPIVG